MKEPESRDVVVLVAEIFDAAHSAGGLITADALAVSTVMADRHLWIARLNRLASDTADPVARDIYLGIAEDIASGHADRLAYYNDIAGQLGKKAH